MHEPTLEELWESSPAATSTFDPRTVADRPDVVRRFFRHALAPGARLATAARLRMHGTMRLENAWSPFEAEQVLRWDRGFVWRAKVRMKGLPVRGFDRWIDGEGAMKWKLAGLVPLVRAEGPDVSRSAAGRLHLESTWLPAVLLHPSIAWSPRDESHAVATVRAHGEETHVDFGIDTDGALRSVCGARWGNPGHGVFGAHDFGGVALEDRTFAGITIASELRLGWWFGTERFEPEGEFFRVTVDDVIWK